MKSPTHLLAPLLALCVLASAAPAQKPAGPPAPDPARSQRLQELLDAAVRATLEQFAAQNLHTNQLAVTLIDLGDPGQPAQASYRGDVPIYPASVVKLFYLVAAHRWLEDGTITDSEELRRAIRDMIVNSYNEATHYVVDLITGTTSGPELPADEMDAWREKRNAINRYFASLGYTHINANQKPWCEGPYGRERLFVGKQYENRNQLTTDATARLLMEIVEGRAVSPARSAQMKKLLERDPFRKTEEPDQGNDYTGLALPAGAKLWSKAGWTDTVRHDAAYVELPNGARFVLVAFTTGHSKEREIIPSVARKIIEGLGGKRGKS
jgi:hypothetical protein